MYCNIVYLRFILVQYFNIIFFIVKVVLVHLDQGQYQMVDLQPVIDHITVTILSLNTVMQTLQNPIITQIKTAQMRIHLNLNLELIMGELSQTFGKKILTYMELGDLADPEKNLIDFG